MSAFICQACHVACCANSTPNVVSWGRGGIVAFGTCNSVALYDPQERRVLCLLNGHTGRVNALHWVHNNKQNLECHLVSGGSDNLLIVWEAQDEKFIKLMELKGHTEAVCAVDAIYMDSEILVASSASDSSVKLWLCSDLKEGKSIWLYFSCPHCITLFKALFRIVPILACGGDDSQVHLYVVTSEQLQKAMTLKGHEDWVRGVEWVSTRGGLLLASCSQDSLIRVWRLTAKSSTDTLTEDNHTIIRMKEDVFEVNDQGTSSVFSVSLETVLAGHENWVCGVHWQPPVYKDDELQQPARLLSASMDKTMIIWAPEEGSGVWVEQYHFCFCLSAAPPPSPPPPSCLSELPTDAIVPEWG
ncbi:Elongator complex protein 2 [Oryzias melastigma]|uniref:Elongator complex protein 2 n=1 Tax=Oryzias melastigma TaxID=30732 RepID=A0A834BXX8_ORYME|nr:Elongator complex protein 2 [Oryzias melastigma]